MRQLWIKLKAYRLLESGYTIPLFFFSREECYLLDKAYLVLMRQNLMFCALVKKN